MQTVTGTLKSVNHIAGSGLATIEIRHDAGITTAHLEAGFGVRQLKDALGGRLNDEVVATYQIDSLGIVFSVEPEE